MNNTVSLKESVLDSIKRNVFNILGAAIIITLFLTKFSEIKSTQFNLEEFIGRVALMFFLILSMYGNYYNYGKQNGKIDKSFLAVKGAFNVLAQELQKRNATNGLKDFCLNFTETELKERRVHYLQNISMEYDYYAEKYLGRSRFALLNDKSLVPLQRRFVGKANACRAITLRQDMILNEKASRRYELGKTERQKGREDLLKKACSFLLTSFFFGYYSLELMKTPNMATLGEFAVQCVSIITSGVFGYNAGYAAIVGSLKERYQQRYDLLLLYLEGVPSQQPQ